MNNSAKIGVLLVNLGTPDSYQNRDVYKYLIEFLTDRRVLNYSWLKQQLLVRGLIVPFRFRQSAELYKSIWTEKGSPLLVHSKADQEALQQKLGNDYIVNLAMRYQNPSIRSQLEDLRLRNVKEIVILPLFPQYASATTGSVHEKVMGIVKEWKAIPKMTFINNFATHPGFIDACVQRGKQYNLNEYDKIIFSFHGLPESQIKAIDNYKHCLKNHCCDNFQQQNTFCYKAQCYATARAIAKEMKLNEFTLCFQSRLGKEPWLQPYASDIISKCASEGSKRLLVFSPSFVSDCLETTSEIAHEYALEFKLQGGEHLQLVEGLNNHPAWVNALYSIVKGE